MKSLVLSVLDRAGIEVDRSTTLRRFLATHPIDLVVDAGANTGQFGALIRKKGYRGRIWSFEPVQQVFKVLAHKLDPLWTASQFALGDADETRRITVPVNHTLSSFLKPSEAMAAYDGEGAMRSEEVEVRRLDGVLEDDPAKSIFLKMDVQGFEKQVLEGAKDTLKRTHAIYVELPIAHLYEGSWTFAEAVAYMENLGFTPAQFRTVTALPHDRASATEFDCLFRRL